MRFPLSLKLILIAASFSVGLVALAEDQLFVPQTACDLRLADLSKVLRSGESIVNPFNNPHFYKFRVTTQQMIIRELSRVIPRHDAELLFARSEHRLHDGIYIRVFDGAIQDVWISDGPSSDRNLMSLQYLTAHIGNSVQKFAPEKEAKRLDRLNSPRKRSRLPSLYDSLIRQTSGTSTDHPVVSFVNPYVNQKYAMHQSYVRSILTPILAKYFLNLEQAFGWVSDRTFVAVEDNQVVNVIIRSRGRSISLTWFEAQLARYSIEVRTPHALMKLVLGNLSTE